MRAYCHLANDFIHHMRIQPKQPLQPPHPTLLLLVTAFTCTCRRRRRRRRVADAAQVAHVVCHARACSHDTIMHTTQSDKAASLALQLAGIGEPAERAVQAGHGGARAAASAVLARI